MTRTNSDTASWLLPACGQMLESLSLRISYAKAVLVAPGSRGGVPDIPQARCTRTSWHFILSVGTVAGGRIIQSLH